uniref:Blue copper protein-like n=2 Tax=Nicotiana sylvestris TaxID=4096 RepID=A0A1U7WS64_NICSY
MASKAFLIAIAVVSMIVAPTIAIEHLVGDDQGWKLNFDYKAWAESKEFHIGDKLIFKYKEGAHNVFKADLISFQDCAPTTTTTSFHTGNDVIELTSPGKKWAEYIALKAKNIQEKEEKPEEMFSLPNQLQVKPRPASVRNCEPSFANAKSSGEGQYRNSDNLFAIARLADNAQ